MKHIFKLLIIGIILILSQSARSQDYDFSMIFRPSFVNVSKLSIDNGNAIYNIMDSRDSLIIKEFKFKIPPSQETRLKEFLAKYHFTIKGSTDTTGWCVEIVDNDTLIKSYSMSTLCDGIQVYGIYQDSLRIKSFKFYSPDQRSKDSRLMEIILEILFYNIDEPDGIYYLNELFEYFSINLGLKTLNDSTYILYGPVLNLDKSISDLINFTIKLTEDTKDRVYIDLTGFTTVNDTLFIEFMTKPFIRMDNIYLINPPDNFKKQLVKQGIDSKKIIYKE